MLKFKKSSGTPTLSPVSSPTPQRPKLVSRLDSVGGPVDHKRISLFDDATDDTVSSDDSSSSEEFATPAAKLRDVTKTKLNQQKRKLLKLSAKKQQNLLSSKDYWCRQHELKIWISETTGKDVTSLPETKLKAYFKKFVRKWNKRKLPQKYYRGVDLHSSPLPAVSSTCNSAKDVSKESDTNSLWIAPPIPMVDLSESETVMESLPASSMSVQTPGVSSFGQKLVTTEQESIQSSRLSLEDVPVTVNPPPRPPKRKVPTSILTTLPGATDNPIVVSNTTGVRVPQPKMGSIVSSLRRRATTSSDGSVLSAEPSEKHRAEENAALTLVDKDSVEEILLEEISNSLVTPGVEDNSLTEKHSQTGKNNTEEGVEGASDDLCVPQSDVKSINIDAETVNSIEDVEDSCVHESGEKAKLLPRLTNTIDVGKCSADAVENIVNSLNQPSSTKKARWVEEVENSMGTYV